LRRNQGRIKRFTVCLTKECVRTLTAEAKRKKPLETGGVLIGYWRSEFEVMVADVIGPGPQAVHSRTSFAPDYDFQESQVADVYRRSLGRLTYLGDWHSHPGGVAALSERDRRTLARIAASREARVAYPLMVILAGGSPWNIGIWVGQLRRSIGIRRLVAEPALWSSQEANLTSDE